MAKDQEDDLDRARRLVEARERRGIGDAKKTANYFGWNYNSYSQHERGLRGLRLPVAEKYARAFKVPVSWLLTGEGDPGWIPGSSNASAAMLSIDKELLRQALLFVLRNEGVPEHRASLIADILPEALSGVAVDAVGRDPLLSFRVHYQLEERRFGRLEPR